jgi:hypothetical protein
MITCGNRLITDGCHPRIHVRQSLACHGALQAGAVSPDLEILPGRGFRRESPARQFDGWIESARKELKTDAGRRIADAAITPSPLVRRDR